ncbi:MAG: FAD:protein FMN transferase [Lachnospiraceae bacterium]|nr:FAD:protein FMN transferase [Lachnospiraceae bacterium]
MNKSLRKSIISILIITCFTTFWGCTNKSTSISESDFYFDTVITITLFSSNEEVLDECFALCEKYEKLFSNTIPESDISKINANSKKGLSTKVSDETIELLNKSLEYCELSNGKFDITIGNLSSLWDFGTLSKNIIPDADNIENSVSNIGYEQIAIDKNEVLLTNPNISLDLGGSAKGYIADKIKEHLISRGVKKGIINLGGNILLIGSKENNSNYNIGIQKPFDKEGNTITIVSAKDKSIVTSGVYERYFYKNDILYHHILDTNTGYPVNNDLLSVTIISTNSIDGDILSTTAFVYGLEEGIDLIESLDGIEAVFIDCDYELHLTSGLEANNGVVSIK